MISTWFGLDLDSVIVPAVDDTTLVAGCNTVCSNIALALDLESNFISDSDPKCMAESLKPDGRGWDLADSKKDQPSGYVLVLINL